MSKIYEELDERLRQFIMRQKLFFVASAPRSDTGLINVSPKGMDTLRILDGTTIAYLDLTGSGVESIAHLKENGRFVMMFCSFDEQPLILRLHGRGRVVEKSDSEWEKLRPRFPEFPTARAIVVLSILRIADSCGWGVPRFDFAGPRDQYGNYASRIGEDGLRQAQLKSNLSSIDRLPGLKEPSV